MASTETTETPESEAGDPRQRLAQILAERPDLAAAAIAIFDYSQYLLDDDERLTKSGALDGAGRDQLRARALETLGGPTAAEDVDTEDDKDLDDDDGDDDRDDDGDGEGE
ncbi:MAG: hypothetical protein ACKV2T_24315 [Kofleriaceae bacterium]